MQKNNQTNCSEEEKKRKNKWCERKTQTMGKAEVV